MCAASAGARISNQLIRAADQTQIWAETFERPIGDILRVQAEVADVAVRNIRLNLATKLPAFSPVDPQVYDSYLRARYLWDQRTTPAIHAAIEHFENALQRDSRYAPAWPGLGNCFAAPALTSDARPRECFPKAAEAASRALALDASLSEAHIARGLVHFWFGWGWTAAECEFRRAAELNPSNSSARMFLAHLHSNLQRHTDAILEIRSARQLDPLSRVINTHEGHFLYNARRYDEAIAPLERILELAPRFWIAHLVLGKIFGVRQRLRAALAEFSKAHRYSYANTEPVALRGYTLGTSAHAAAARSVLRQLDQSARKRCVPPLHRSLIWLGLVEYTAALEALENAEEERDVRLNFLAVELRWDPLRNDPRFQKLCQRVGFAKTLA